MAASAEWLLQEVEIPDRGPDPASVDLESARKCVAWMLRSIVRLNQKARIPPEWSSLLQDFVLTNASQCAILWRSGLAEEARNVLVHVWLEQSSMVATISAGNWTGVHDPCVSGSFPLRFKPSDWDREFVLLYVLAVSENIRSATSEWQARQELRNIMSRLELTPEDLARVLSSSVEEVDAWESGRTPIPFDQQASLQKANNALMRMLSIFRPERLPQIIRRPAELFGGQTALDWIVQGRIGEVADKYDTTLAYQA